MNNSTALGAYIFAGAFTTGVKKHFNVVAHYEGDNYGVSSARRNFPGMPIYIGKENWPLDLHRDKIDFIFSNVPCAVFSIAGIATTRGRDGWRTDPRMACWYNSFGLIEALRPRAFALESVTQAYTTGREVVDDFTKRSLVQGYSVTHVLLDAKWHGIPQSRRRFFFIAHKPAKLTGYALNWAPPPTIGEILAEVPDPGPYPTLHRKDLVEALRETLPGHRLQEAWERQHQDQIEELRAGHPRGFIRGRPSFADRRLAKNEISGAFIGEKFFHPVEDRFLGYNEKLAICGYPEDFICDGPITGWGSLLARAVLPPVADWISRSIAATLGSRDASLNERCVTLIDLREPERNPVDLTSQYLDAAGRVRLRLRADGSVVGTPVASKPVAGTSTRAIAKSAPMTPAVDPPSKIADSSIEREGSPGPIVGSSPSRATVGSVARAYAEGGSSGEEMPPGPPITGSSPALGRAASGQCGQTGAPLNPAHAQPSAGDDPVPLPGEGSGKFIQRLWLAGLTDPDRLVELVLANWPGRKTKRSDIYYNYRILLDAGIHGLVLWPGSHKTVLRDRQPREEVVYHESPYDKSSPSLTNGGGEQHVSKTRHFLSGARRVLLTGATPMQVGSSKTMLKIVTGMTAWNKALQLLGYDVDWRPVTVGEDLSGYDRVVVSLHKPNAIVSRHFYGAHYALAEREDAVLVVDDWQTQELVSGIQTCARNEVRAFRLWGKTVPDDQRARMFGWLNRLADTSRRWPWPTVVTIQGEAKLEMLGLPADVVGIDPTNLIDWYPGLNGVEVERQRRWVQASLLVMPDVKTSWSIDRYGNPGRGEGGIGKTDLREAQPRVVEAEIARIYTGVWGMLAPPHKHPGSGWWRPRYTMAANAGAIASGHPTEAATFGEPYVFASDPARVEGLSDAELKGLAADQRELLERISWPRERALEAWRRLLRNEDA